MRWGGLNLSALMVGMAVLPLAAQELTPAQLAEQARQRKQQSQCKVWTTDEVERPSDKGWLSSQRSKPAPKPCAAEQLNPALAPPPLMPETAAIPPAAPEAGETPAAEAQPPAEPAPAEPAPARDDPTPDEIKPVRTRWRTYNTEGYPEYGYRIYDPYHQNLIKADYPIAGKWFMEVSALETMVFKARRNLDFSNVFADQIAAGTLEFFRHNNFFAQNLIFGTEFRRNDDAFVPSNFRVRINGVADFKNNINAFIRGSHTDVTLFDAFVDVRLADFGHSNFDQLFLRGGIQGFKSDFHGLVFNDVGLGGRLFGEVKKNRLRYDLAYFKLFQKDPISGFIDFTQPSRRQVAIARLAWEDFLVTGWNSEWTFHYNRDHRKQTDTDLDTFYLGASFNGHVGRVVLNPAVYFVTGHADALEAGVPVQHSVAAWMGLVDVQYPLDFMTFRAGYVYASGDGNPADRRDTGFDAISDGTVLFGGPLSYWVGENIRFGRGDFLRANSFYPSFRGANAPSNYINPGLQLVNLGSDFNLSPRLQMAVNLNYMRFNDVGPYTNRIVILDRDAGLEGNIFVRWKPFLRQINENLVFDNGFSILNPLPGMRGAFQSSGFVYSTFSAVRFIF
ncbi:MAG TPA: hypothetical protein VNN18_03680 [Candidatus Xenobia bacterium]|nr:hypothetical protein [Candidatus Xenobia bacterium]